MTPTEHPSRAIPPRLISEHEQDIRMLTASDNTGVGLQYHMRFPSISDGLLEYFKIADRFCRGVFGIPYNQIHMLITADTEIGSLVRMMSDECDEEGEPTLTFTRVCEITQEAFGVDLRALQPCYFAAVVNEIEKVSRADR
jgi:hypothetical protein